MFPFLICDFTFLCIHFYFVLRYNICIACVLCNTYYYVYPNLTLILHKSGTFV